jgi:hypothetical protein
VRAARPDIAPDIAIDAPMLTNELVTAPAVIVTPIEASSPEIAIPTPGIKTAAPITAAPIATSVIALAMIISPSR